MTSAPALGIAAGQGCPVASAGASPPRMSIRDAYGLLRGAPEAPAVARTAVLGTTTQLVMEATAAAQHGLPALRDAAMDELEAILGLSGVREPMLRPILATARAAVPERAAEAGEAEERGALLATLLRQFRAHCAGSVGIQHGEAEMERVAEILGLPVSPWGAVA